MVTYKIGDKFKCMAKGDEVYADMDNTIFILASVPNGIKQNLAILIDVDRGLYLGVAKRTRVGDVYMEAFYVWDSDSITEEEFATICGKKPEHFELITETENSCASSAGHVSTTLN